MNRWQEKNKDGTFKTNSNTNTTFKTTHKHKSQELTVISSILIFKKARGVGDKW